MSVNLSEAILQVFIREGITDAFGIPGAGINGFYAAMAHHRDCIHHITMRHEECCVHAASGYYRASGKLALALCTSGPGATNFVTGIYSANIDSIPIIAITGQAVRSAAWKRCLSMCRYRCNSKAYCQTHCLHHKSQNGNG